MFEPVQVELTDEMIKQGAAVYDMIMRARALRVEIKEHLKGLEPLDEDLVKEYNEATKALMDY